MKYTVGQQLWYKDCIEKYKSCVVIKVLENSMRYRVKYNPWGDKIEETLMDEMRLFPSVKECIDSEIVCLIGQIAKLNQRIDKLQKTKTELTKEGEL